MELEIGRSELRVTSCEVAAAVGCELFGRADVVVTALGCLGCIARTIWPEYQEGIQFRAILAITGFVMGVMAGTVLGGLR